jgi:hypothetical protein
VRSRLQSETLRGLGMLLTLHDLQAQGTFKGEQVKDQLGRGRARHHRERIIRKRHALLRTFDWWSKELHEPGRCATQNPFTRCSCDWCRPPPPPRSSFDPWEGWV